MDFLFNTVGGIVVEVGKFVCKCIYPKIENVVRFSSKIENLREEMEKLTKFRDEIKEKTEKDEREGYKPKPEVVKWIEDVCELQNEWEDMQQPVAAAKTLAYKCFPKCSLRLGVTTQAHNIRQQLSSLKQVGERFGSNLVVDNNQMKKVEFIAGPSIKGQSAATRNLNKILRLLEDDKVCIIGVWGSGGIGKTTLVKNLNNELLKIDVSIRPKLSFGVVVWVTVPKPPIAIRKVQAQIADRLNLKVDAEGSEVSIASKISERLKQEKSFLVILDDVWEAINLDDVGVPQLKGSKVIITSRFLGVCMKMKSDTKMSISTLDVNESWALFMENAGDVANRVDIEPLAKKIARECDGLPLAITVIATSMRGKNMVEQWEDALESLRKSEPYDKDTGEKVYQVIKWSFDSLEQTRNRDIQSCFLYCSLYPAAIPTDDLIRCWWAEGFLGEHDTYENAYNRGITTIEELKDVCLLEKETHDCVKLHDVVRDVAKWIDDSSGLTDISRVEQVSASVKRLSFIIQDLPDNLTKCPKATSLLLQNNNYLHKIPQTFLLAFPALRVLNLSGSSIRELPCSINELHQLRALILQRCFINVLPAIGNLCNLQLLDCDGTALYCLPKGMDKLKNLRLLNIPLCEFKESIHLGFFQKLKRLEMLHLPISSRGAVGAACFDEISHLPNLKSLSIYLDRSSISNMKSDQTWMRRLKRFRIAVGNTTTSEEVSFNNNSTRAIRLLGFDIFNNKVWVSSMLQFASDLYLEKCMGLAEFIRNHIFDGLKSLHILHCSCDFGAFTEECDDDRLPNLENLFISSVNDITSVSNFGQLLGLRFSKLRKLDLYQCHRLTCVFDVGKGFSVPRHLEEISVSECGELTELVAQLGSSSEIPRVRKLRLYNLESLRRFGEAESMWEHLEELDVSRCNKIMKLPLSIQTSKNIKIIRRQPTCLYV
ncbi:hypothetical protein EJD97_010047 [Solanum chilense]|uniref:Uncharacterized protein n=1 Tax=Solanum chilense TaxID=4083 RepID=A0A6N2BL64_SOLCI|nr:hypothetical protein EJD97_010047 [Solanum chilense]